MTSAPQDLLSLRRVVMTETGLTDPASVGIVGDGAHQRTGGYHEGRDVLASIGRYHPAAPTGSTSEDYSAQLARDRAGLTDSASGVDIGYRWPRGGNAAWLRFNNMLINQLIAGDPALSAIRAVNYSPDGNIKRRRDREVASFGVASSTNDTVDVHTHIEFYRDTEGRRGPASERLGQIIRAAVSNTSLREVDVSDQAESILAAMANGLATFTGSDGKQHDLVPTAEIYRQIDFRKTVLAKLDAIATALASVSPADPQALANALSGPLAAALNQQGHQVTQQDIVAALGSQEGQNALIAAANYAEDH